MTSGVLKINNSAGIINHFIIHVIPKYQMAPDIFPKFFFFHIFFGKKLSKLIIIQCKDGNIHEMSENEFI